MIECYKTGPSGTVLIDEPEAGCWVNVVMPTVAERAWLLNDLGIVPEFVASAFDVEETSHIDYDDDTGQVLVIVDYPAVEDASEAEDPSIVQYDTQPFSLLLLPEKNVIVTVAMFPCETVTAFAKGKIRQFDTRMRTRFLLQALLHIAQRYQACLTNVSRQFIKTEKALRKSMRNEHLIKMLGFEKSLLYFSTSLRADQATLTKIRMGRIIKLYEEDQELLDDVFIEVQQATEMCSIYSSILTRTMETFGSVISNNLNSVMRTLTIITVVLAMPTIVFSFYGMNVDLPLDNTWLLPAAFSIALAALVAVLLSRGKFFR